MKQILTFIINNETFGVDISEVNEIIRADYHITPIPKANPGYIGVFKPRDNMITAIDLMHCFFGESNKNLKSNDDTLHNKYYIMCDKYAWFVDTVEDIVECDENKIIEPSNIVKTNKSYITGIYKNNEELIQIVDFNSILDVKSA